MFGRLVRNPLTGAELRVGGGMYNDIVGTGRLIDNGQGRLVYQVLRPGDGSGSLFAHPSPRAGRGDLMRDTPVPLNTARRVAAFNEFLAGRRYEDIRDRLGLVGFVDGWLTLDIDGLRITRDPNDMDGTVLDVTPMQHDEMAAQLVRRIRRGEVDVPVSLPFENVLLNARTLDSRWAFCGERILGAPIAQHTLGGLCDAAEDAGVGLRIWSLTGRLLRNTTGRGEVASALVHDNHFYLMADEKRPTVITGPEILAQDVGGDVGVRSIFDSHDACYFERNGRAYLNDPVDDSHNGVYVLEGTDPPPDSDVFQEWMAPFFSPKYGFGPSTNWCRTTLELAQRYNTVLSKGRFVNERDFKPDEYITIDMDKCYYTAFRALFDTLLVPMTMPFPTVFSEWRACDPDTHDWSVKEWYAVQHDYSDLGGIPPIIPYVTFELLRAHGFVCRPYAYITYDGPSPKGWRSADFKKILGDVGLDKEKQRDFVNVQGMWERLCEREVLVFDLGKNGKPADPTELNEYAMDGFLIQHFENGRVVLTRDARQRKRSTRYHLSIGVKQAANYLVLRTMLKIYGQYKVLPVKVKTDGLMYRRDQLNQFAPIFHQPRSAEEMLRSFLTDTVYGQELATWKFEESKPARGNLDIHHSIINVLDPPQSMVSLYSARNQTFFGPPGVGKTLRVSNNLHYDYAVAYTNDRATANGGITVHSLFGIRFQSAQPDWEAIRPKLQDRTIWFDEVQMATMQMWSWFAYAFEEFNIKLIMTGDPDQLCAIEEKSNNSMRWDIESQFFGRVSIIEEHPLSRNADSPELIEMREGILEHNRMWALTDLHAAFTVWNIAFHNSTCEWVNDKVSQMLGQVWGGDGVYVAHDPPKSHPTLVKATLYVRKGDLMTPCNMDLSPTGAQTFWMTPSQVQQSRKRNLRWAYCQTGYKCIGKTFPSDVEITIWECGQMTWSRRFREYMYTAVTRGRFLSQLNFRASPVQNPCI